MKLLLFFFCSFNVCKFIRLTPKKQKGQVYRSCSFTYYNTTNINIQLFFWNRGIRFTLITLFTTICYGCATDVICALWVCEYVLLMVASQWKKRKRITPPSPLHIQNANIVSCPISKRCFDPPPDGKNHAIFILFCYLVISLFHSFILLIFLRCTCLAK